MPHYRELPCPGNKMRNSPLALSQSYLILNAFQFPLPAFCIGDVFVGHVKDFRVWKLTAMW